MATATTISISLPLEVSIEVEAYLEKKKISRSEFVRNAIVMFLDRHETKKDVPEMIERIFEEIKTIKFMIDKNN